MNKYLISYTYSFEYETNNTDSRNYSTSSSLYRTVKKTVTSSGIFTQEEIIDLIESAPNIQITHSLKL